ncbi:thiamine pyrophosphate dependent pyruvate decarboxylase family protein [Actinidia rufa]|uniref:pyruvate decarboxylase n=1 Tax=Actinidia rufa TaxID=165716 RepID=A0A7J0FTT1_9ERIC|nr:thiamine pyrophosphate dependent pyruvate decarboxylase family protein [Actinidia rufa]
MDTSIGALDACNATINAFGTLPHDTVSTIQTSLPPPTSAESTLGRHLARRLLQIGAAEVFSVPGDFNLTLLDQLAAEPGLGLVGCCNELNAGYAADGFARASSVGVGACIVTFTVGGLSVINAVAGAYAENIPAVVNNLEDAHELIDTAIATALKESKPVYINISCNLPAISHPTFSREPVPLSLSPILSNQMALEAAVELAAEFLNKAVKPVL